MRFFFSAPPPAEFYALSLHDALPISAHADALFRAEPSALREEDDRHTRSEEHTSELQPHHDPVSRLLLEKKKNTLASPLLTSHLAIRPTHDTLRQPA